MDALLVAVSSSSLAVSGAVSISSIALVGFGRPFVGGDDLDAEEDGGDGND